MKKKKNKQREKEKCNLYKCVFHLQKIIRNAFVYNMQSITGLLIYLYSILFQEKLIDVEEQE